MSIPNWLRILLGILVFLAFVMLIVPFLPPSYYAAKDALTGFAAMLTLAALLAYVYFTFVLAQTATLPSASIVLQQAKDNPYRINATLVHTSKLSLECWCNVNATVNGQSVKVSGFYGGQTPWPIAPLQQGNGYLMITDGILSKIGLTPEQMKKNRTDANYNNQLRLNVEFWYFVTGSRSQFHNSPSQFYFDFGTDSFVLDV